MTLSSHISVPAALHLRQARRALPTLITLAVIVATFAAWYAILDMTLRAMH